MSKRKHMQRGPTVTAFVGAAVILRQILLRSGGGYVVLGPGVFRLLL